MLIPNSLLNIHNHLPHIFHKKLFYILPVRPFLSAILRVRVNISVTKQCCISQLFGSLALNLFKRFGIIFYETAYAYRKKVEEKD